MFLIYVVCEIHWFWIQHLPASKYAVNINLYFIFLILFAHLFLCSCLWWPMTVSTPWAKQQGGQWQSQLWGGTPMNLNSWMRITRLQLMRRFPWEEASCSSEQRMLMEYVFSFEFYCEEKSNCLGHFMVWRLQFQWTDLCACELTRIISFNGLFISQV